MKQKILLAGLVTSVLGVSFAFANQTNSTSSDSLCDSVEACETIIDTLDQQLSTYNQAIEDKTQKQTELKQTRELKTQSVETLRTSVLELKEDIQRLEKEIQVNETKRHQLEEDIAVIRNRINHQMIISQREKNKNSLLTFISEAESFTDLIQNLRSFNHFSRQGMEDIAQIKVLVEALNDVIRQLEQDQEKIIQKQKELEKQEALLIDEINQLIEIEKRLQTEIQQLQSYMLDAEEVKRIVEEQRQVIIKESDDYFGNPTEHGYVTCEFKCYIDKNGNPHSGIDIGNNGDTTTKILASLSGVVTTSGWHRAYGNYVMITHNVKGEIYTTLYAHMHDKPLVKVGDEVTKGQQIGYMGTTGNSTGVHLHFEIYKGYYRFPYAENPRDFIEFPTYW